MNALENASREIVKLEARIKELEAKLKEYEAYNPWPDDEQCHAKRCRGYKDKS